MGYRQQYEEPDEQEPGDAAGSGPEGPGSAAPPRVDSVAEQIKRQLRDEAGAPQDKSFDFQMTLRAGGNELNDTAREFADDSAEAAPPPEFREGGWGDVAPDNSGAMRGVLFGVLAVAVIAVGVIFGLPAFKEYQAKQAQSAIDKQLAEQPPLEAVAIDDALHASLAAALGKLGADWKAAGKDAYVYRYRLTEELAVGVSQKLTVVAVLGGKDAAAQASAAEPPAAFTAWQQAQQAHPGVTATLQLEDGTAGAEMLEKDRYIRYGYDFGREHMQQFEPVIEGIDALAGYPRALNERMADPPLKTTGGFKFLARGFGYLPIYATDGAGNIQMGSGSTREAMTPREVTGYYLILYVNEPTEGLDFHSADALDYYTHKIAPLPYDTGGERLRNVPLKPDGKPDGIGAVVKNGKLLADGAR